jgi:hypothetical protein
LQEESNPQERTRVLKSIKDLAGKVQHNRNLSIVGVWHGTTVDKAEWIMQTGFANLGLLDEGWFGKGIYFTSFPGKNETVFL